MFITVLFILIMMIFSLLFKNHHYIIILLKQNFNERYKPMFISTPELIEEFKNVTRIENHKIIKY